MDYKEFGLILADARALPIRGSCIDLIISNPPFPSSVLWDSYYGELCLIKAECRRVLKSTGTILFLEPDMRWWRYTKGSGRLPAGKGRWAIPPKLPGWGIFYPEDIEVLVTKWSQPGDLVYDPMGGIGTVAGVATKLDRIGLDSDISTWRYWQ